MKKKCHTASNLAMKNWSHRLHCARIAVSSTNKWGLTRHTKINLKCLIWTTTLHFCSLSPLWGFKDQTLSMWCYVYTVWCHHTNLAQQFCLKASSFMEQRASSARSLFVSVSYWNSPTRSGNIYKHKRQRYRGIVADTVLLTGQTRYLARAHTHTNTCKINLRYKQSQHCRWILYFNRFDEVIKVLLQAQEAINNSTTEGSQIQNKMKREAASVGESIYSLFRLHGDAYH